MSVKFSIPGDIGRYRCTISAKVFMTFRSDCTYTQSKYASVKQIQKELQTLYTAEDLI